MAGKDRKIGLPKVRNFYFIYLGAHLLYQNKDVQ